MEGLNSFIYLVANEIVYPGKPVTYLAICGLLTVSAAIYKELSKTSDEELHSQPVVSPPIGPQL
ncbi:hypothetical protein [Pseudomonas luteola]|uniref:Uncharacterized protein n=1 Tax=Pseudomonas luteola TaxID=47886 RepID=A0ABS0FS44_PSELU|nr:hypothetical protein [Pseudomonas zeshuii]MBF8643198.1 hypothetical protein [Pseudomonas zeshuii]